MRNFNVTRRIEFTPLMKIEYNGIPDDCPLWARRWILSRFDWSSNKKHCQLLTGDGLTDEVLINGISYKKPGVKNDL